jgi:hypothetical protein
MSYIYNLTDTWNAAGTTFAGIKMVVTNTASGASSKLLDFSVSGATSCAFSIDKSGNGYLSGALGVGATAGLGISLDAGGIAVPQVRALSTTNAVDTRVLSNGTNSVGTIGTYSNHDIIFAANTAERARIQASTGNFGISTSAPTAAIDVGRATASGTTDAMQKWTWNAGATTWGLRLDLIHTGSAIDFAYRIRNGTTSDVEAFYVKSNGLIGFGTTAPTAKVDINSDTIRLRTTKTPASATAAGNAGDICWDSSYVYVCVAANTWKRAAIATW